MKRPLAVKIIGWFFILAGAIGFGYHLQELDMSNPLDGDAAWILLVRLLAVAGGILVLLGVNVGRWLLIAWMAYHVVLSYFHNVSEFLMHATLLIVLVYFLLRPGASLFFTREKGNR
jgi:hypothetical protein